MAKTLPARFNPDLMSRDGTRYEVTLPIAGFARLRRILASAEGDVRVTAMFSRRKDHIVVGGRLCVLWTLECQRCLEPMRVDVDVPYELVFVESEAAARDLPKALDPVILDESGQIRLVDLFEDELILHVPDIPKHDDAADCDVDPALLVQDTDVADGEGRRVNPFDVLKDLNIH